MSYDFKTYLASWMRARGYESDPESVDRFARAIWPAGYFPSPDEVDAAERLIPWAERIDHTPHRQ